MGLVLVPELSELLTSQSSEHWGLSPLSSPPACVLDRDVAADTKGDDDGVDVAMDENSVVDDSPLGFLIFEGSPTLSDSICFLSFKF